MPFACKSRYGKALELRSTVVHRAAGDVLCCQSSRSHGCVRPLSVSGWGRSAVLYDQLTHFSNAEPGHDVTRLPSMQMAAVAALGQTALTGVDPSILMEKAVRTVRDVLDVEYCGLLRVLPGHTALLLAAADGARPGRVRRAKVEMSQGAQAAYTLNSGSATVVEDLLADARFTPSRLLLDHRLVSGITVPLRTVNESHGLLDAYSVNPRRFTSDDVRFLQCVAQILADAITKKAADEALQREAMARGVLAEIGCVVSSSIHISAVYENFARLVSCLIPFDRITISRVDQVRRTSTAAYSTGMQYEFSRPDKEHSLAGTVTGEVVKTHHWLVIGRHNAQHFLEKLPTLQVSFNVGLDSVVSVPLIWQDEVIAVLTLRSTVPDAYSEQDAALVQRVAMQITGAIAHADQRAAADRHVHERLLLAEIGRIINSSSSLDQVFEQLSQTASELIPFDRSVIVTVEPEQRTFTRRHISGVPINGLEVGVVQPLAGTITESIVRERSGQIINPQQYEDGRKQTVEGLRKIRGAGIQSMICVPLIAHDDVVGALSFCSKAAHAYTDHSLLLAERVATQLASAIAASRLQVRMQVETERHSLLSEIGYSLVNAEDSKGLFEDIEPSLRKLLGYELGVIALVDSQRRCAEAEFISGPDTQAVDKGQVAATFDMDDLLIPDPSYLWNAKRAGYRGHQSALLRSGGVITGILLIHHRSSTQAAVSQQLLNHVANLIAPAIQTTVLQSNSQHAESQLSIEGDESRSARQMIQPSHLTRTAGTPITALIVDNQVVRRGGLKAMLTGSRIDVVADVGNVESAESLVKEIKPAVILYESHQWYLWEMLESICRLKQICPNTNLVILKDGASVDDLRNALRSGASALLSKQTPPEVLIEAIVQVAEGGTVIDPKLLAGFLSELTLSQIGPTCGDRERILMLSDRDRLMLAAVAAGQSNAEVATVLNLSVGTVKNRLVEIYRLIGAGDRVAAAAIASRAGLVK